MSRESGGLDRTVSSFLACSFTVRIAIIRFIRFIVVVVIYIVRIIEKGFPLCIPIIQQRRRIALILVFDLINVVVFVSTAPQQ